MSIAEKLKELGIELPPFNSPVANYSPAVLAGELLFTSGQIPKQAGKLLYQGRLGESISDEDAYQAARICALNTLTVIDHYAGGLDNVAAIVKVTAFLNAVPEFTNHAKVANGATDLLVAVFGDCGRPSRSAIGVGSLPAHAPCELEMVVRLKDASLARE
jgi:enamine deaminase RidA (YjgF/YER057c/UK114 family)